MAETNDRATVLSRIFGDTLSEAWKGSVYVESANRLTGGASRETWELAVSTSGGIVKVIARIEHPSLRDATLVLETEAIRAANRVGIPAPTVYAAGEDDEVGGNYLLMEFVEGETIARKLLRDDLYASAREGMAHRLGAVLAQLHTATVDNPDLLETVTDPYGDLVRDYLSDGAAPAPGLALGLQWLRDHQPESAHTTLVHGDFRLGNLLIGPDGLHAVLDWELVHIGDPVEDLGWLCAKVWRFGSPHAAGGFGSREELLDGYESVAGWRPSDESLFWWELLGTIKWGLMTRVMTSRHLTGQRESVELAAIGRRTCEQEFDVLLSLGIDEPHEIVDVLDTDLHPQGDLYGRPNVADLARGVRAFLVDSAIPAGGALGFNARVASNVVDMIRREAILGPEARAAHAARLTSLGIADEDALSRAILDGSLSSRWDEVTETVKLSVRDRLAVANPSWASHPA